MKNPDEGLAVLCTTENAYETEIVSGLLESEGLWHECHDAFRGRAVLRAYGGGSMSDQGHVLLVREGDLERARELFASAGPLELKKIDGQLGTPTQRTSSTLLIVMGCAILLALFVSAWQLGWLG